MGGVEKGSGSPGKGAGGGYGEELDGGGRLLRSVSWPIFSSLIEVGEEVHLEYIIHHYTSKLANE